MNGKTRNTMATKMIFLYNRETLDFIQGSDLKLFTSCLGFSGRYVYLLIIPSSGRLLYELSS